MSAPGPSSRRGVTPAPTPGTSPGTAVEALQTTLAAEHAAVFVYAALGAQTSRSEEPALYRTLLAAYRVHRGRRDDLRTALVARGATPVAAEAAYALPADLATPAAIRARAREVEAAVARAYAYLVARSDGETRTRGIDGLIDAAVRELALGGTPRRLPGLE